MPARRIIIAPEALADLNDIWDYVSGRAGTTIASDLIADILDMIDRLADVPGMGHERLDVGDPSYRFLTVKSHVIAYLADDATLRVVRVVHGSRDFGRLFP